MSSKKDYDKVVKKETDRIKTVDKAYDFMTSKKRADTPKRAAERKKIAEYRVDAGARRKANAARDKKIKRP